MRAFVPRRAVRPLSLLVGATLFLSCGDDGGSPSPTPTSVFVTPGADTLISVGENQTFTATVLDANGDPIDAATVTWSSDAPSVVTIDAASGVATAVANGSAHVKATAGALEGSANVIVTQIVTSVTVTPGNVAFTSVGDTARFTAVAKDAGNTVVPGVQILWSVSDNTVATIDTLGLAKAKGPGTALVSAQAQTRAGYAAIGVDPNVTHFVVLGAPTTGVAGDPITTALQVELRDARGNRVMNSSLAVTVTPAGAATGTPLHGTTTLLADQGRATFTNLWFEKAGPDRLTVTVGALAADSTSLVTIAPAAPARAVLDPLAGPIIAGAPIAATARVSDRFANATTNYDGPVVIRRLPGPAGLGDLFGDTSTSALAGVAHFTTLNIHKAAAGYDLAVSIPDLPGSADSSGQFTVFSGAPTAFEITAFAPLHVPFMVGGDTNVVTATDSFGNLVENGLQVSVRPLYWTFAAPPGRELRLLGDTTVALVAGRAVFQVAADRPGRIALEFTVPGLGSDTTETFVTLFPNENPGSFAATAQSSCLTPSLCVGDNAFGQLGVPTAEIALDSVPISRDSAFGGNVLMLDGGGRHLCAVVEQVGGTGRVSCWGDNSDGQLGGGTVGGTSPVPVPGVSFLSATALSAGGSHSCVAAMGTTQCWGKNDVGQLGSGSAGASTGTPVTVTGNHNFLAIAAGGRHTCALEASGAVWCWGANDFGQLGNGDTTGTASADPVQVASGIIFSELAAGDDFTCATHYEIGNYAVYCWGRNDARQLGTATDSARSAVPVAVIADTAQFIFGTLVAGARFACVGINPGVPTGSIQCWGANEHGQLGRGSFTPFESVPGAAFTGFLAQPPGSLVAGAEFVCGATMEFPSRYICWGRNDHGQFGTGNTSNSSTPLIPEGSY